MQKFSAIDTGPSDDKEDDDDDDDSGKGK